jgi:hypothetical protein
MSDLVGVLRKDPAIWDEFTRPEEYFDAGYDSRDRFLFTSSGNPDPLTPRVSAYLQEQGVVQEYPDGHPFAVVLSHDVDDLTVLPRHLVFAVQNALRHREVSQAVRLAGAFVRREAVYRTFRQIMETEQRYGATSSFYFLASPDDVVGRVYTLRDVEGDMKRVVDAGCEVGFHTGFWSYNDPAEIVRQRKAMEAVLGSRIVGARNHYMRFRTPRTWEVLAEAGFRYDSTYGYPDMIGFRNGVASAFVPYNRDKGPEVPILGVPVMVQDWTMMYWMRLTPEESLRQVTGLMDAVAKVHGVLTVLWHSWTFAYPASFGGFFTPEWTVLYDKILQQASLRNAWITDTRSYVEHLAKTPSLYQI